MLVIECGNLPGLEVMLNAQRNSDKVRIVPLLGNTKPELRKGYKVHGSHIIKNHLKWRTMTLTVLQRKCTVAKPR